MKEILIPNRNPVSKGVNFSVRPQIGPTYESFRFYLKGGLKPEHLSNIKLDIRGVNQWDIKNGKDLQMINAAWGRPMSDRDDVLVFWFYRPELEKVSERHAFSLGTMDVDTVSITMDIAADAPVNSDIEVKARVGAEAILGMFTKIRHWPQTFAQGGQQVTTDLPTNGAPIAALHMTPHSDGNQKIKGLEFLIDNVIQVEGTRMQLHDSALEKLTPQDDHCHLAFMGQGSAYEALSNELAQDKRIKWDLESAAAFGIYAELLDTFGGA